MTITVSDLSSAIWNWLSTSDAAANYRAVIQDATITEAGFLDQDTLVASQAARRSNSSSVILGASVQDGGDDFTQVGNRIERVVIRHYDREYGYRNLRTAREYLVAAMRTFRTAHPTLTAIDGVRRGILELRYEGRTGHRRDMVNGCDWEAIAYSAIVIVEE